MRISAKRGAVIAIVAVFLALVRCLAEIYRLRAVRGAGLTLADALPYVNGAMMATIGGWIAVGFFMWKRHRLAIATVSVTVLVMLVYKLAVMGW